MKIVNKYQKYIYLGQNTSVTILQTVSNQEVTLKKTDKHAADCSKAIFVGVKGSM